MSITATIDRFEGDIAVLVVEPERTVVNVPRSNLPKDARQGDVVRLEGYVDREETDRRRSEIRKRIEHLKRRDVDSKWISRQEQNMSTIPQWLEALGPGLKEQCHLGAKDKQDRRNPPPNVWHVEIHYRQWDGPRLPWSEDFGKASGQVYSLDGQDPVRSCNEVEVAKLLRSVRPEAYWISGFAPFRIPNIWRPWTLGPDEAPEWLKAFDRKLRPRVAAPRGGMLDVVAWDPERGIESVLFAECKGPKEKIKEAQEDWVAAAMEEGIPDSRFAAAIRVFR